MLPTCTALQGFVGLHNIGNSCFANAIVQCLSAIPELLALCLRPTTLSGMTGLVSKALASLVRSMWQPMATRYGCEGFANPTEYASACVAAQEQPCVAVVAGYTDMCDCQLLHQWYTRMFHHTFQ